MDALTLYGLARVDEYSQQWALLNARLSALFVSLSVPEGSAEDAAVARSLAAAELADTTASLCVLEAEASLLTSDVTSLGTREANAQLLQAATGAAKGVVRVALAALGAHAHEAAGRLEGLKGARAPAFGAVAFTMRADAAAAAAAAAPTSAAPQMFGDSLHRFRVAVATASGALRSLLACGDAGLSSDDARIAAAASLELLQCGREASTAADAATDIFREAVRAIDAVDAARAERCRAGLGGAAAVASARAPLFGADASSEQTLPLHSSSSFFGGTPPPPSARCWP